MFMKSTEKSSLRGWLKRSFAMAIIAGAVALAAPAQANDTIKIGFSMALTGGLAGAGKGALIAMQVWAEDVNAAGGLLGKQVELIYYDDQTNPATVPAILHEAARHRRCRLRCVRLWHESDRAGDADRHAAGSRLSIAVRPRGQRKFNYPNYFQIMPAGPEPMTDWSKGFFDVAMAQDPPPKTIALIGADAEFAAMR